MVKLLVFTGVGLVYTALLSYALFKKAQSASV